jgi:hypothetical protein
VRARYGGQYRLTACPSDIKVSKKKIAFFYSLHYCNLEESGGWQAEKKKDGSEADFRSVAFPKDAVQTFSSTATTRILTTTSIAYPLFPSQPSSSHCMNSLTSLSSALFAIATIFTPYGYPCACNEPIVLSVAIS